MKVVSIAIRFAVFAFKLATFATLVHAEDKCGLDLVSDLVDRFAYPTTSALLVQAEDRCDDVWRRTSSSDIYPTRASPRQSQVEMML